MMVRRCEVCFENAAGEGTQLCAACEKSREQRAAWQPPPKVKRSERVKSPVLTGPPMTAYERAAVKRALRGLQ